MFIISKPKLYTICIILVLGRKNNIVSFRGEITALYKKAFYHTAISPLRREIKLVKKIFAIKFPSYALRKKT